MKYDSWISCVSFVLLGAIGLAAAPVPDTAVIATADTLSGRLPRILSIDKSPYVVVGDITVPLGRTVIIEAGTVLLFNSFTSLKVQGTLLARGSSTQPVVFTSVNDKSWNPAAEVEPAPYDWNGIQIFENGVGTTFSYCTISYSVFGIMSMTKFIRIEPTLFRNNGRGDLSIEGVDQAVGDTPYEYELTVGDVAAAGIPLTILKDPLARKRSIARFAGLGAGIAGFAVATVYTVRYREAHREFVELSDTNPDNLTANSSLQWHDARARTGSGLALMCVGYALGLTGAIGFSWSLTF